MHIMGRKELNEFLPNHPKEYNVVFITEPSNQIIDSVPLYAKSFIPTWFHDVIVQIENYVPPTKAQIQEILDWAKDKTDIVVACAAGISRSSAIAYLITYQNTKNIEESLKILTKRKHKPNALIVKYGSEIFNCPELYTEMLAWIKR